MKYISGMTEEEIGKYVVPDLCKRLDVLKPNWYENIDLDTLRMVHPKRCVMGQLYPKTRYNIALQELGFLSEREPQGDVPFAVCDEVWKEEIAFRQRKKGNMKWACRRKKSCVELVVS